ncbi:MAG: prepilin-type N-terminal cleavage/methylation domain-containing protein [Planctomycetes bacterium]|nr:prepilin-type N-terminal cleavage/methylation domain-containing protein [Planctomycetota bacterium]
MKSSKIRGHKAGFTLIEVMVAVAIIAVVSLVLLARRVEIVRDAAATRDLRTTWLLAGWKMGEVLLDPSLGQGMSQSGTFDDLAPEYAGFQWTAEANLEEIGFDESPQYTEKPKALLHVKVEILNAEGASLQVVEAMVPPVEPAPPGVP